MAKKTPETDFGVKKPPEKTFQFSRLNPNFEKIGVQRAEPIFFAKTQVEPAQLENFSRHCVQPTKRKC